MAAKLSTWPWGAIIFGTLGSALLVRAVYRSARAVMADGYVTQCPGVNCADPSVHLRATHGEPSPVYSVTSGKVVALSDSAAGITIHIASSLEPIVLEYRLPAASPYYVAQGASVAIGQQIAAANSVRFAVEQLQRGAGGITSQDLEPTSWLAARGLSLASRMPRVEATGETWCQGGRTITAPSRVVAAPPHGCGMKLPRAGGFMLLPVNVSTE